MKNRNSVLMFAGMFLFLFLISFASATLNVSPSTLTFNDNSSKSVTVISNESVIDYVSSFAINGINFNVVGNKTLDSNNQTILTITPQGNIRDLDFNEEFTSSFGVSDSSETETIAVNALNNNFCSFDNPGNLELVIDDISVEGYGDDDNWFPFDKITVEVVVENNGNEDVDDIELEWGLYDNTKEEWIIEVDEEDSLNVKEDDEETITIAFTIDDNDLDIDIEDLEDGSYTIYARATGEVDDASNANTCDSDSEDIDITIEKDFVVLSDLELPETIVCDSSLQISADVWNIGSKDQDNVEVKLVISEWDVEEYVSIGDIDSLTSESFSINLDVPADVTSGTLKFSVLDEDGDVYEADNDDELSMFSQTITVSGECSSSDSVDVSAVLQEGGQAGKPLIVKATLVNSGTKSTTYAINVAGYADWAESVELSQNSIVLDAGQSKEVIITLNVKSDAIGEKLFNLEVLSGDELVANQPVSVDITKKTFGITGFSINKDNWHLWGIGFLNVILVVVIIVIAIRVARK